MNIRQVWKIELILSIREWYGKLNIYVYSYGYGYNYGYSYDYDYVYNKKI